MQNDQAVSTREALERFVKPIQSLRLCWKKKRNVAIKVVLFDEAPTTNIVL